MGIILGLAAALFWGVSDFTARSVTQRIGTYRTLFFMQFIGMVGLGLYLFASGTLAHLLHSASWQSWAWALLAALLNIFSTLALYRSFEIGVLAIVSPIAASSAALTVLLALLSGETVSEFRAIGISGATIGVVLAATQFGALQPAQAAEGSPREVSAEQATQRATAQLPHRRLMRGVGMAALAAIGYGITFWLLGFHIVPELGGIAPIWLIRLLTPCVLALCAVPARQSIRPPAGSVWWQILVMGTLDTTAFICLTIGLTTDQVSVVSVLSSLFSAVTVFLAWLFLREKLAWNQWLGIIIIFLGIILVKL
ncbi:MAG TPA: EamA family transporter [Ktedonobacteraceae bacterium]